MSLFLCQAYVSKYFWGEICSYLAEAMNVSPESRVIILSSTLSKYVQDCDKNTCLIKVNNENGFGLE